MTLDAHGFFTILPGVVLEIRTLGGMTTCAGQHLAGPRIKDIFSDRMGE